MEPPKPKAANPFAKKAANPFAKKAAAPVWPPGEKKAEYDAVFATYGPDGDNTRPTTAHRQPAYDPPRPAPIHHDPPTPTKTHQDPPRPPTTHWIPPIPTKTHHNPPGHPHYHHAAAYSTSRLTPHPTRRLGPGAPRVANTRLYRIVHAHEPLRRLRSCDTSRPSATARSIARLGEM